MSQNWAEADCDGNFSIHGFVLEKQGEITKMDETKLLKLVKTRIDGRKTKTFLHPQLTKDVMIS